MPAVLEMAAWKGLGSEVIVVDDASTDDSLEFLASRYPEVTVVRMAQRGSFLGAANEGFRRASNHHVALLSNDMAPARHFLEKLLEHFDDSSVFAVHSGILTPDGQLQSDRAIGRFFLGNFKILNTAQPHRGLARWLLPSRRSRFSLFTGSCAVFDRDKFFQLGGLDSMYLPFYWEDVDLCFRAWKKGWKTVSEPDVTLVHHHDECGTIRNNFQRNYIRNVERRNRFLFLWSNIDSPVYLAVHLAYLVVSLLVSWLIGRFGFYASFLGALRRLPAVFERRRARADETLCDEDVFAMVLDDAAHAAGIEELTRKSAPPATAQETPAVGGLEIVRPVGQS